MRQSHLRDCFGTLCFAMTGAGNEEKEMSLIINEHSDLTTHSTVSYIDYGHMTVIVTIVVQTLRA